MFDEQSTQFFGLIISPYFQQTDLPTNVNAIPLIRCFLNYKEREIDKTAPFEIPVNIIPQTRLDTDKIIRQTVELRDNPFTLDKIMLNKESCQLKKRFGNVLHLKKGDKLIRSLKQILQVNYDKLRKKSSMCYVVRNIDYMHLVMNNQFSKTMQIGIDTESHYQQEDKKNIF